jgi:adenylate cyclase
VTEADRSRKLATILAADVAGYSAHAEHDDAAAAAGIARMRVRAGAIAASGGGRIFNTAGDAVMVEFPSASAALNAAAGLLLADDLPPLRIGLHVGDVIALEDGDLLGHGVNVAARLQQAANPGEALVSGEIRRLARGDVAQRLVTRGPMRLAKMDETVETFLLVSHAEAVVPAGSADVLLAVLPFENQSADPDMQFFSDGVSEEILNSAARISGLRVMSSTSSFTFRGAQKSHAARELGATHILDGSVRRSGTRVRVAAQLADARSGVLLWSERYDRQLDDVFALQDEIAAFAAAAISAKLAPPTPKAVVDLLAYDCFLRAREQYRNAGSLDGAVALLEEAVTRAPDFADAWALLARVGDLARFSPACAHRNPVDDAKRAISIDPDCAMAYVSLATIAPTCGHFMERDTLFQRALALAPDDSEVLLRAAYQRLGTGRVREAAAINARAFEIDPLSISTSQQYAIALWCEGRTAEAVAVLRAASKRWPSSAVFTALMTVVLTATKDWVALAQHTQRAATFEQIDHPFAARLRQTAAALREPDTWRPQLCALMEQILEQTGSVSLGQIALLYELGDTDAAMDIAARASFERLHHPATQVDFSETGLGELFILNRALERDPRAMLLFAKLGLCAYWSESGLWPDFVADAPNRVELEDRARSFGQVK